MNKKNNLRQILRKYKVLALQLQFEINKKIDEITNTEFVPILHYQIDNWGDAINRDIVQFITAKKVLSIDIDVRKKYKEFNGRLDAYMCIGSILSHADSNTIVWGSGFQDPVILKEKPKEICAVRGPLTKKVLSDNDIECPSIYGDPALILPSIYSPTNVDCNYDLGLIVHRKDLDSPLLKKFKNDQRIKLISMKNTKLELIDEVLECKNIVSSSLHGLILGDAYEKATGWIRITDKIAGSLFKYHDYHASLSIDMHSPLQLDYSTTIDDLLSICRVRRVSLNVEKLLQACPFH